MRLQAKANFDNLPLISIHAPTRGATETQLNQVKRLTISIHAPTRGATNPLAGYQSMEYISIHAPTRGATLDAGRLVPFYIDISIHAPTRGATARKVSAFSLPCNFNPRTHTGCDSKGESHLDAD